MGPKTTVLAPPLVMTLLFGGLLVAMLYSADVQLRISSGGLLVSSAVYLVVVGLLVHFGLRNLRKLEWLGLTDSLCLLPNRRALHLDIRERTAEGLEVAVALIDFDGFKAVNDHYGHAVGDALIKTYAAMLDDLCADTAKAYRLGGDEFALVLVGPLAGNLLEGICRKLLIILTKPQFIEDRAIALGASIGLTRCDPDTKLVSSELLRQADVAMYASKTAGKMRCTWYDPEFDRNRGIVQDIDGELRDALSNDEFRLVYQPLVSAADGRIVSVEALIRWDRPGKDRIGPNIFIPLAERSGLINAIGMWVLRRAIEDSLEWDDLTVSVNVSATQLRNPEFPIALGHLLEDFEFDPARLELEVTETQLVLDSDVANRSLEIIRSFGVRVALDDFGTGYASIGFLRKCRFEKLKLDRTLIVDAIDNESTRAMMMASITLAKALEMGVTAEGVETEAQAALARAAGCSQIQGWLYYKAMPADELSAILRVTGRAEQCMA